MLDASNWIIKASVKQINDRLYSVFQVTEYTKLSIQNLQLAVYHSGKDAAAQVCQMYRHNITHTANTLCICGANRLSAVQPVLRRLAM